MSTAYQQSDLGRLITDAIQQINGSDAPARLNADPSRAVAREPTGPNVSLAQPKQCARLDHGPPAFGGSISCRGQGPIDGNRTTTSDAQTGIIDRKNGKHVEPTQRGSPVPRGVSAFGRQMARLGAVVDRALGGKNHSRAMIAVCAAVLIFIF